MGAQDRTPVDQLVDLFVYAPIGWAYEYREVLPQLIRRGRSQVQLARVLSTMAARQGQQMAGQAVGEAASVVFGAGDRSGDGASADEESAPTGPDVLADEAAADTGVADRAAADAPAATDLPIAGYADLTAREIIPLLDDLSPSQRERVAVFEAAHRNRKTVLGKIDRLRS